MAKQLQINFDEFPEGIFKKVKEEHSLEEAVKMQQLIEHQKRVIAAYKGHHTRKKNK